MGRKKTTFYEVRESDKGFEIVLNTEVADAIAEDEDAGERRPERGLHREAMRDLKALANKLSKLPRSARRALPLDEAILDQLDKVADAGVSSERRRFLMRLKLLMRDIDFDKLQAALDGDTPAAARGRELERWRTRILQGGNDDIHAFLEEFPAGDSQQIRAAAREARGEGPNASRASRKLFQLLKEFSATPDDAAE
jgi:ribosome-associated protein